MTAFGDGYPDAVHLRLVAAFAKDQQQFLTGINVEHAKQGLYSCLDRQEVIKDKIEGQVDHICCTGGEGMESRKEVCPCVARTEKKARIETINIFINVSIPTP